MLKHPGKKYYAKILLFGEYTVVIDSPALTIPYRNLSGSLMFPDDHINSESVNAENSTVLIKKFAGYIKEMQKKRKLKYPILTDRLNEDLEHGLFFMSDIPIAYGVGSSGALCAAIFDNYCVDPPELNNDISDHRLIFLKQEFALLESYFHGRSSGIDPLSCYINQPLVFRENQIIIRITLPELEENFSFFLADTRIVADTGPLVKWFMDQQNKEYYRSGITGKLIPVVEQSIRLLIDGNSNELFERFKTLSLLQSDYFSKMIPAVFMIFWEYGLTSELFYLKLCGSGGGGFLLGYTRDIIQTEEYFSSEGIKIYKIRI